MDESQARQEFRNQLVEHGFLVPTAVTGIFGRTAKFEDIVIAFNQRIDAFSTRDGSERMYFPPVIPRMTLEKAGYLESMPHLCGTVHTFEGDDARHRELLGRVAEGNDWSDVMSGTDMALAPAACYPLYPTCGGRLPEGGRLVDLSASYVFRHEPSDDPARMQMFRQREIVRIGTAEDVQSWRETWLQRGQELLASLGLAIEVQEASDPFFGRGGRMMAATQRQQRLKFEIVVPICSSEKPTAITSFNYHREHFGQTFGIETADGSTAHTACLGFGAERVTLGLIKAHGFAVDSWPSTVRGQLWP